MLGWLELAHRRLRFTERAAWVVVQATDTVAGNVISDAIRSNDVSAKKLQRYDREVREELGKLLDRNYRAKEFVVKTNDDVMNSVAKSLAGVNFENMSVPKLLKEMITRNPGLFIELAGLF